MITAEVSSDLDGDKLYQLRAKEALPILVRQAKASQKIYYADLANEISIPNPRNLNYPLGSIGTALMELSKKWGEEIPQIQFIVVNQSTGLPGEGIEWFIKDTKQFSKLSSKQKKALVDGVLAKIYGYNKWDKVLNELGLIPFSISNTVKDNIELSSLNKFHSKGGEGEEHKKLKEIICNNPEHVGIKLKGLKPELEKSLPSGDSVDVSFSNNNNWVGIEVKSIISNEADILRGLYQCVKYSAVMESTLSVMGIQKDVKVILALGGKLPKSLISVKNTLGITVLDNLHSQ